MNEHQSPSPESLSLARRERIDGVCDDFEEQWKKGKRPRIEDFFTRASQDDRRYLLRELLSLELECRENAGERVALEEYRERFSNHPDVLNAVWDAHRRDVLAAIPIHQRYAIEREIGRGGMGVVFRARHRKLDMVVAVKILQPGVPETRFLREAKTLALVDSQYVVKVLDFDLLEDGRPMMCMEWIDGGDLLQRMRESGGKINEKEALVWMEEVAEGMADVARREIIHRDLKPSNILLDAAGSAHVADFGVALGPLDAQVLLQSSRPEGTYLYMAPEQVEDPRRVDTRADIYSFGAAFYHAVTGRPPFNADPVSTVDHSQDGSVDSREQRASLADSVWNILLKHKIALPDSPKAINPDVSDGLSRLLERCLAKSPAARFQTFDELVNSLRQLRSTGALPDDEADPLLQPYLDRYRTRRHDYLAYRFEEDRYEFPGNRTLRILIGDITRQQTDAVVSGDDSRLIMSGGVSYGIRTAAGADFAQEARDYTPIRPGRVLVTRGMNQLGIRFIFHAIVQAIYRDSLVYPSRDVIAEAIDGCFYHADSLYVETMAFPLLGTGGGRFSRAQCLDTMFASIVHKLLFEATSVREVRIVLLSPQDAKLALWERVEERRKRIE